MNRPWRLPMLRPSCGKEVGRGHEGNAEGRSRLLDGLNRWIDGQREGKKLPAPFKLGPKPLSLLRLRSVWHGFCGYQGGQLAQPSEYMRQFRTELKWGKKKLEITSSCWMHGVNLLQRGFDVARCVALRLFRNNRHVSRIRNSRCASIDVPALEMDDLRSI